MIRITIEGPQGEGKIVIARDLALKLRSSPLDKKVRIIDDDYLVDGFYCLTPDVEIICKTGYPKQRRRKK